jgi:4-diphosphocytidyl-2-C-methyl-D-erythritol kinase
VTLAPAKVNLVLRVGPRRDDGFHEVITVLAALDVGDEIELEPHARVEVETTGFAVRDTLVTRALTLLAEAAGHAGGWRVRLDKRIPVGAGLGGGSSDAGTALRLANARLPRPLGERALLALAARVGSDVPFFAAGWEAALGTGRGELLQRLGVSHELGVALAWPGEPLSTAAVYAAYRPVGAQLLSLDGPFAVHNDLAATAETLCPATGRLRRQLADAGAIAATVSGSGSAVFGLFSDHRAAERALAGLDGAAWSACAHVQTPGTVMA